MTDTPPPNWTFEHSAARRRIGDLVAGLDESAANTIVAPCPDWTVHDVVSHVVGLSVALSTGDFPSGDVQEWIDDQVERRRSATLAEVLSEWGDNHTAIDDFMTRSGPGGARLVYDIVAHEHDIALALDRPGDQASSGVLACTVAMSELLVDDLSAAGLPALRITSGGRTWDVGDGEPGLAIELEPFELIRALGSRRSERQLRALPWQGDIDRYLPALTHLPLPLDDIVE